jgi:hypothetical protein
MRWAAGSASSTGLFQVPSKQITIRFIVAPCSNQSLGMRDRHCNSFCAPHGKNIGCWVRVQFTLFIKGSEERFLAGRSRMTTKR